MRENLQHNVKIQIQNLRHVVYQAGKSPTLLMSYNSKLYAKTT